MNNNDTDPSDKGNKISSMSIALKNEYSAKTNSLLFLALFIIAAFASIAEAQENRTPIIDGTIKSQHRATVLNSYGEPLLPTQTREAIHPDDSLALVAFYHSMQGDYWLDNAGWLELPVDFWVGVDRVENVGTEQEPEWRVTRIETIRNNMTRPGVLPAELGNMSYLARFRVGPDLLTGTLPVELGNMQNLERLQNDGCYLTGEVPWDVFKDLPRFNFWVHLDNFFYGTGIPDHIGEWPSLQRLDIRGNQDMTGTIPAGLANAENLVYLRIGRTQVGGDLPNLGHLEYLERIQVELMPLDPGPIWDWLPGVSETLEELYIHYTNRTGTIPEWLPREMTNVTDFSVGEHYHDHPENALGGHGDEIPELLEMINLERLYFYGPFFTGNIPDWLGNMIALERLYITETNFEGPIPGSLANLNNLERLKTYRNHKLTGGLPNEFSDLGTITHFIFHNNSGMQIGQLPAWLGDLTSISVLDLANSGITGTLPDLSRLTNLNRFVISDNPGLVGDLPDEPFQSMGFRTVESGHHTFNVRNEGTFDISRTGLNVTEVPAWLNSETARRGLSHLGLAGLGIEGELPAWLGEMVWMRTLALDGNNFTGSIPSEFGGMLRLDSLNLANNQLSGTIPDEFANIGRLGGDIMILENLILSGNADLEGLVPSGIADATYMRNFSIDGTKLCLAEGMAEWVASIPGNSFRYYPRRYASVGANVEYCSDVSVDDPTERVFAFRLNQNYPNPFNPATTISYEIPVDGQVTLHIYNVVGQRVATLVNEMQSAGSHNVGFDASRLASGSYIYRLQVGDRTMTRTMMLIK